MATEKTDKKERDKNNKEYAADSLKSGVPQANIALHLTLANLLELDIEQVAREFKDNTKLVQEAFREL